MPKSCGAPPEVYYTCDERETANTTQYACVIHTSVMCVLPRHGAGLAGLCIVCRKLYGEDSFTESEADIEIINLCVFCCVLTWHGEAAPGKMYKTVIIQRQPIPGTQVGPDDKVGIGIAFAVTAKGEVFITGACVWRWRTESWRERTWRWYSDFDNE